MVHPEPAELIGDHRDHELPSHEQCHDPARTDDQLDSIVANYRKAPVRVDAATEGMVLEL